MTDLKATFARHGDGIGFWVQGQLVATLHRDSMPALIYTAADVLTAPRLGPRAMQYPAIARPLINDNRERIEPHEPL